MLHKNYVLLLLSAKAGDETSVVLFINNCGISVSTQLPLLSNPDVCVFFINSVQVLVSFNCVETFASKEFFIGRVEIVGAFELLNN